MAAMNRPDSAPSLEELRAEARAWLARDPEPERRAEIERLIADDPQSLGELFGGRLEFGTAGLRAALGPGPRRMNRLVVRQTTAGLMRWMNERSLSSPVIVVGYDARHGSWDFAEETARVVAAGGGRALVLPCPLPTPVLAAAVLACSADAGVMITASHNPPADNGYKLYLADGIQLVEPADTEIAEAIAAVAAEPDDPLLAGAEDPLSEVAGVRILGEDIVEHHIELAASVRVVDGLDLSGPRVVYTALHGVGGKQLLRVFERIGATAPVLVEAQFAPDPDFPTVAFPNPEEPGALDLALATAVGSAEPIDAVFANDPDADRLAIAVRSRDDSSSFVRLSGDELGVLLADHLLRHTSGPRQVATSIVSSRLLAAMAEAAGVRCTTTLTGFKWVARPALAHPEETFVLGYEEAIGYSVGGSVRDKDGISAAVAALEILADAQRSGESVWDRLDRLARAHGLHVTTARSIRYDGEDVGSLQTNVLRRILASPPTPLGDAALVRAIDLSEGRLGLPPTEGVLLDYEDRTRLIVRPSGTEPKLKAYLEIVVDLDDDEDPSTARVDAEARLVRLGEAVEAVLQG